MKMRARLELERLEDRSCPAVTAALNNGHLIIQGDPAGTLSVRQVGSSFRVKDGATDLGSFAVAGDIRITLGGDADRVMLHITAAGTPGDVRVNLGAGNNLLRINPQSAGGVISGNLILKSGAGHDLFKIGAQLADALAIGGHLSVLAGVGSDNLRIVDGCDIAGNVTLSGVNGFALGGSVATDTDLGGNLVFDSSVENRASAWLIGRNVAIDGLVDYTGNDGSDSINLSADMAGDAIFRLRGGTNTFALQGPATIGGDLDLGARGGNDSFFLLAGSEIQGKLTVSALGGNDEVRLRGAVTGNAKIDLGDGTNRFIFQGTVDGSKLDYQGGAGADTVNFSGAATFAALQADLGGGNDLFKVNSSLFASAFLDGGAGTDTLEILVALVNPITDVNFEN